MTPPVKIRSLSLSAKKLVSNTNYEISVIFQCTYSHYYHRSVNCELSRKFGSYSYVNESQSPKNPVGPQNSSHPLQIHVYIWPCTSYHSDSITDVGWQNYLEQYFRITLVNMYLI